MTIEQQTGVVSDGRLGVRNRRPGGLMLAGTQLGWFSTSDEALVPYALLEQL